MGERFLGSALNGIDAKNRVSIPSGFRETVQARAGSRAVLLAPAERAPCLIGYDRTYSDARAEQSARRFGDDSLDDQDDFNRLAFAAVEQLAIDDNGRIILSDTLKELGEFDRHALFLGAGDYFEIWNPRTYLARPKLDPRMERIVRRLLDAKGAA